MSLLDQPPEPSSGHVAGAIADSDQTARGTAHAKPDLSDEEKLKAHKIVEEARSQFLTWLKWTFGLGILFIGLIGLKGYSDWTSMLEKQNTELDTKIRKQVEENLQANYKARTDDVLDSAVKARTEIAVSSRVLSDLQSRSKDLERELTGFSAKLSSLEKLAEGKATEFTNKLDRIAADFEGPAAQANQRTREQAFLKRSRDYATKLALTLPEPRIVFREDSLNVLAMYDTKTREYVVSPSKLDTPGLAEYAALMGGFFEKNRDLLDKVGTANFPDIELWQNFRQSVVNYLLVTDGVQPSPPAPSDQLAFYKTLKAIESKAGTDSTRKLAIALLEAFDRDWSSANFNQKVLAINEKIKALPDQDVKEALNPAPK